MRSLTPFHGFCMALADSVPGVSGGTVAFILGFYDRFINALHDLFGRDNAARKTALAYLLKLGVGWIVGMGLCVSLLAGLFADHIYFMSSLFLGLTAASVPFVTLAEKDSLRRRQPAFFALLGAALVVGLTMLRESSGLLTVDMAQLRLTDAAYLFLSGAVAITAMVLPGISGSSVLLIAGVYLPVIQAIRQLLHLDLHVLPGLMALGLGVIACAGFLLKRSRKTAAAALLKSEGISRVFTAEQKKYTPRPCLGIYFLRGLLAESHVLLMPLFSFPDSTHRCTGRTGRMSSDSG